MSVNIEVIDELSLVEIMLISGGCDCYCNNPYSLPRVVNIGTANSESSCAHDCAETGLTFNRCV